MCSRSIWKYIAIKFIENILKYWNIFEKVEWLPNKLATVASEFRQLLHFLKNIPVRILVLNQNFSQLQTC